MFRLIRWLIKLAILLALIYACLILYVWIQERKIPTEPPAPETYDAIIILGAQVKADGVPSVQLEWRLEAALKAWQNHPVPIVVCGAKGGDEPRPEAEVMADWLAERGVPRESILEDATSFNTNQNLANAGKLLSALPSVQKVLVVTSDYHAPRALALAEDQGYQATGLGSPCKQEYWIKNHAREALAWLKYWGVKYLHLPLE